jgi:hypothetical protein
VYKKNKVVIKNVKVIGKVKINVIKNNGNVKVKDLENLKLYNILFIKKLIKLSKKNYIN